MDIVEYPERIWREGERRSEVIAGLAQLRKCSTSDVASAASELNLSMRQIYKLLKRYRRDGSLSSLIPAISSGGKGKHRTKSEQERLMAEVISDFYCSKQKPSGAAAYREVVRRARDRGIELPSLRTLRRRISAFDPKKLSKRVPGSTLTQSSGETSLVAYKPLDIVQIDHTPVDLIIVDSTERQPIGRPYLTLAIDVFSRCVCGFYLSLDPPSATSVALCITSIIANKAAWLLEHDIDAEWPLHGKPECIHVDNGSEFHGEAFERGCSQHGIRIHYRPPGRPHYGGIVERLLGTLMKLVHEIPGTTFSSPVERGKYASEKLACLTLKELESWLLVAITKYYHSGHHKGLRKSPLERLDDGYKNGFTPRAYDEQAIMIDFLPVYRRTLQREGIELDHILYFSNTLTALMPRRRELGKIIVRRDPRDLSQVYLSDPDGSGYIRLPYRSIYRPPINIYEHRAAIRNIRQKKSEITEDQIFSAIEEMRRIEDQGKRMTSKERRKREKRPKESSSLREKEKTAFKQGRNQIPVDIKPFDDVEIWQ